MTPRTGRLSDQSEPAQGDASSNTLDAAASPVADADGNAADGNAAEQLVDDPQGTLLWASPTAGAPLSLAYMPAGVQCLVHLRPALVAAHPEGEKVLAALGPWGQDAAARLKELTTADFAEVESVLVGVVPNKAAELDASLRVTLRAPWTAAELAQRLPSGRDAIHAEQPYRVVGDRAYFLPQADARTLVVCPAELAAELIDSAGEAPPATRDLERLVEHSDDGRAATVIVAPKFLHASGSRLLADDAAPLRDALQLLVANDATAVAISAHWDDNFFLELLAVPALNVPPRTLAVKLRKRIEATPDQVEEQILAAPWHPYGRKVLARFPAMLRKLAGYSRHGDEDQLALVRAYLPPIAGHNLLMGAELLLTQPQGDQANVAAAPAPAPAATLEERLAKPTSLVFTKESLQRALELLAADIGVEIRIAGGDLQVDGITKNQSLGLELRDQPAADILLEILRRANPDRTATGPADPKQNLVYVIEPAAADGPGRITVTTRAAVEKRGGPLPAVFVGAPP